MARDSTGNNKRWACALATIALLVTAVALGVNHFQKKIGPADSYLPPRGYVCYRATGPLAIDGKLDETAWAAVPWTDDFLDIEGALGVTPRYRTRVKMLWDDKYFYVGAELEEPHVQASYTKHDSYIFHEDNDFEVFIDPDGSNHNYVELEMNALNTTWDLLLNKPYRDGGTADDDYEIEGLKTAVHIDGKLNEPGDRVLVQPDLEEWPR